MRVAFVAAAMAAAAAFAAGCGKSEAPKVDKAAEEAQAKKRARTDVFGEQVKGLEGAKALPDDLNKKAQENLDRVDNLTK